MNHLINTALLALISALFVASSLKACDVEYANQQQQVSEWQAEQYISPADQMIIDWREQDASK